MLKQFLSGAERLARVGVPEMLQVNFVQDLPHEFLDTTLVKFAQAATLDEEVCNPSFEAYDLSVRIVDGGIVREAIQAWILTVVDSLD